MRGSSCENQRSTAAYDLFGWVNTASKISLGPYQIDSNMPREFVFVIEKPADSTSEVRGHLLRFRFDKFEI